MVPGLFFFANDAEAVRRQRKNDEKKDRNSAEIGISA